jgi:CHASE2 domain-containing sensor protein
MLLQNSGANGRRGMAGPGALLLILVTLLLLAGERLSFIESSYYDFLQSQHPKPVSGRILLIDTNSQSSGTDLWDAKFFSGVIEKLNSAGAALIVPVEPPPAGTRVPDLDQLTAIAELENLARKSGPNDTEEINRSLANQLAGFRKQFEDQATLASTVKNAGNLVLPISTQNTRRNSDMAADDCPQHSVLSSAENFSDAAPNVKEASGVLALSNSLCEGAANAGYDDFWPDNDGIIRRTHLLVKSGTRIFPALALAVAQADHESVNSAAGSLQLNGTHRIEMDDADISTGPGFTSLIRYYQSEIGQTAFPTISVDDLLDGNIPSELLKDRIVLIGNLKANETIGYRTPYSQNVAPAEMLATTISNLLQTDFVLRPYWLGTAELIFLFVLGVVFFLSAPSMSINRAATLIAVLVVILMTAEAYLFIAHGIWVQLVTAALFTVLGIGTIQATDKFRLTAESGPDPQPKTDAERASHIDTNDQLDLAFSVLRQQAPTEETKKRLYAIAVTHGKLKEYSKAERVLIYLAALDPQYRDVGEKLKKLSGARKKPQQTKTIPPSESAPTAETGLPEGTRTLGRYQLERTLGRGAMATVYLGTDPKINRRVAIKTIALAEEFSDADLEAAKAQFRREAESAGRLNHPNIIAIYDTGEDGNVAYLAMEYFEGKALNYYAQSTNLLPPKWVLELTARAAEALHYAHGQGVVHRDIKPANLMYDAATDTLKITDFGIARLTDTSRTKTGIILGTPSYMSPEQLAASAVTGKSDLYSLAITMYQLLTGTTPFRSDSIPKLMDKIINDKHKPVSSLRDDVPLCVDVVLDQALAKSPDDRFANGRAMALALRDCVKSFEEH